MTPDPGADRATSAELRSLASDLFGEPETDQLVAKLERHAALIQEWNGRGNLVSKGDVDRILSRHIPESLRVAALVRELAPSSIIDIGSGAGLPGIPIALVLPEVVTVLLESRRMKSLFLLRAIGELGLERSHAWCARAETIGERILGATEDGVRQPTDPARLGWTKLAVDPPLHIPEFDLATARAVAPLNRLTELAAPLIRSGGSLIAIKGSRLVEEIESWERAKGPWTLVSRAQDSTSGLHFLIFRRD